MLGALGFFFAAYLLGSVNTAIAVARLAGRGDVREVGSGNPGATNTLRLLGKGYALLVLLVDGGRGAAVWLLAEAMLEGPSWPFVGALGVVVGNLFPLFHGFRGGKGVATTLGLFAALAPLAALIGIGVWILVAATTRYASLASLSMAASYPLSLGLLGTVSRGAIAFAILLLSLLGFTHRQNIVRLLAGREHRLGARKPGDGAG